MVCANQINQVDAKQAMPGNWIETWKKYVQSNTDYFYVALPHEVYI